MPDSTVHAFDFIAIGEILSDLISCTELESLKDANTYQRFVGGQPTNLSRNMALLGNNTALAACVGSDTIGEHIIEQLRLTSVDTRYLQTIPEIPDSFSKTNIKNSCILFESFGQGGRRIVLKIRVTIFSKIWNMGSISSRKREMDIW